MTDSDGVLKAFEDPQDPQANPDGKGQPSAPKDADWRELHTRMKDRDLAMLKDYDNEIDTLLVFAGLFSAILTAFIIDVYADLKVDSGDTSARILLQILQQLQGENQMLQAGNPAVKPHPSAITTIVLALWFVGLMLSLLSALFCIFMKQWLHAYNKWTDQNSFQQGLVLRDFYQAGLQHWRIPDIFTALGVLLQLALVLFVVGLVGYLWTLNFVISPFVTVLAATMVALSISTILLPVFNEDCPYKFPLAYVLLKLRTRGAYRDWAERDLPVAEGIFKDISALGMAVNQTSLLLDVSSELLEEALRPDQSTRRTRAVEIIRDRIRQLSPTLTQLLVEIVTSSALFDERNTATLSAPINSSGPQMTVRKRHWQKRLRASQSSRLPPHNDPERLYRFWKIALCTVERPPAAILRAVRHLAGAIRADVELSALEEFHVHLLVDLLEQCGALCQSGDLPSRELAEIALVVDERANRHSDSSAGFTALRTLCSATRHIQPMVMHSLSTTELSPFTPYLRLLDRLKARASEARQAQDAPSQSTAPARDTRDGDLNLLIHQSTSLHQAMADRHSEYLFIRRKGFRVEATAKTVVFTSDSRTLYVGTDSGIAWAIDMKSDNATTLRPSNLPKDCTLYRSNFTRDGRLIIWGSNEGPVLLFNHTGNGLEQHFLLADSGLGRLSRALAISWNDEHVLIGSRIDGMLLFNVRTREVVRLFERDAKRPVQAAFSPPPFKLVATSSWGNTAEVWDLDQRACLSTLPGLGTGVNGVVWSPDGSLLAISSEVIRVFERTTFSLLFTLEGHSGTIYGLAFSPSGELLASCSDDKTVRVWSTENHTSVAVLAGLSGSVYRVDFSPDGSFLACAADDGAWVWEINPTSRYRVKPHPGESHEHPRDRWRRVGRQVGRMQNTVRKFQQAE